MYFYPADDTETCTLEAQAFSARASDFRAAGARVIGISPDSIASHRQFRDKYGLAVELACDADLEVCRAFQVWRSKTLFGRTYMGIERTTVLIDFRKAVLREFGARCGCAGMLRRCLFRSLRSPSRE